MNPSSDVRKNCHKSPRRSRSGDISEKCKEMFRKDPFVGCSEQDCEGAFIGL